jgi:Uma2 family endonuclease
VDLHSGDPLTVIDIPTRLCAADFAALPDDRHPVELMDGVVLEMSPLTPLHQTAVVQLVLLLNRLRPDGRVFVAPIAVYLDDLNVVEPDVLWLTPQTTCQITATRLEGAPDLVVEILSPSTARHDKTAPLRKAWCGRILAG